MRRRTIFCVTLFYLALPAFLNPAWADVIDVGTNGAVTVYSAPGIYTADEFHRIVPTSGVLTVNRARYQPPTGEIGSLLSSAANRYAINPSLLNAVAWNESEFHVGAVSPKGAFGIMQLMDGTARRLGVNRFDLSQNILGGAAYLKQMLNRYGGDVSLALAAYNAGPDAVDRYRSIPPFQETRNYVQRIQSMLAQPVYSVPQSVVFVDH